MTEQNRLDNEIEHFDAHAAHWWDPQGPFKTLHQINPVRLAYVQRFVALDGERALDVGCGGGVFAEALSAAGAEVSGVDLSAASLQVAELHALESGAKISYHCGSVEAHAHAHAGQFKLVSCLEMLEHVPDPASIVRACAQALAPGGVLILSTLNRSVKAMALGIVAAEHVLQLIPKGTHRFDQLIKPSELVSMVRSAGLLVDDVCGMRYNPFTGRAQLVPEDVGINYLLAARKP